MTSAPSAAPAQNAQLDGYCLIGFPITFDRLKDTLDTIEQIKVHNAIGAKLCGWGTPAK